MKKVFLSIVAIIIFAGLVKSQTDTMYIMKNGVIAGKYHVNNQIDSIIFYKPTGATSTVGGSTVVDIDGNTYPVVTIGTQVWIAKNLATTRYTDGTSVTYVSDNTTWTTTTAPALSWYNNDVANKATYGGLYNWYAVDMASNGNKNICPTGWHVPSDAEWTTMENYLIANGYNYDGTTTGNKIGKAMATATGWTSYTGTGTIGNTDYPSYQNKSGFSALPGGYRQLSSGTFLNAGITGGFWSSTQYGATSAWDRYLSCINAYSYRNDGSKRGGFSVRCTKD